MDYEENLVKEKLWYSEGEWVGCWVRIRDDSYGSNREKVGLIIVG